MLNTRALVIATAVGTALQVLMVVAGHSNPGVKKLFAVGGMSISLLAGVLYVVLARGAAPGGSPAIGGAIAGGACALLGIAVSVALRDVPVTLLLLGTASSVVTGALGGWLARLLTASRGGA